MSRVVLTLALLLGCLIAGPSAAEPPDGDWTDVRTLFAEGRFDEARTLTDALFAHDPDDDQALYWRYRLTDSPSEARDLRRRLLDDATLGDDARALLITDGGWTAYGAGDYESTLDQLATIVLSDEETGATTGLLAGLAWRAQGNGDSSRDALAAVPPDDPDYAWARYRLGQLAVSDGDAALAERYFDMASERSTPPCAAEILLAQWRQARESDPQRAVRIERELAHRFPRSLPAALVAEQEQHRLDLQRSLITPTGDPPDDAANETPPPADPAPGRYTLQFAAFADRARALAFLDAWTDRLPGLTIVQATDSRGTALYKLRAGAFDGMSQARDAAADYASRFDLTPLPLKADESP